MSAESETRLTSLVDPFLGNGASDPPPAEGPAATWFWLFHDMAGRIGLFESEEVFVETLDRFFGFGRPGNDDSGGTASWYVWSAIGLFPVAGQDIFLIGSPIFDSVTPALSGASFTVEASGNSDGAIYVQRATLNGAPLERAYLRYAELADGGRLVLEMGTAPSEWGSGLRPPSCSGRAHLKY